jgi:tRNA(Ile)-lysidine synthase
LYLGIRQNGNYKNLKIFRPLLFSYRKKDTDNYCKKNNISFGVDETNFTDKYTRNRIRKMMNE